MRGPGCQGITPLGTKQRPGSLLLPGNGEMILECSCCPHLAFPRLQETREYEVSI